MQPYHPVQEALVRLSRLLFISAMRITKHRPEKSTNASGIKEPSPFLMVQTAEHLELYSGFHYAPPPEAGAKNTGLLKSAVDLYKVLDEFAAFQATSINNGTLWNAWGKYVTPETRVDWTLLRSLRQLDSYLQEHGVSPEPFPRPHWKICLLPLST